MLGFNEFPFDMVPFLGGPVNSFAGVKSINRNNSQVGRSLVPTWKLSFRNTLCYIQNQWYTGTYCWWKKSGYPVEVDSLSKSLQGFSNIPGGWPWDFWTIKSISIYTRGSKVQLAQLAPRGTISEKNKLLWAVYLISSHHGSVKNDPKGKHPRFWTNPHFPLSKKNLGEEKSDTSFFEPIPD